MNGGSYAKVYLFTLENDFQAIGRVVYPVRETVKTEAEVAAMELVRCKPHEQYTTFDLISDQSNTHQHTSSSSIPILLLSQQPSWSRVGLDGISAGRMSWRLY
jgi:hypothetical protein